MFKMFDTDDSGYITLDELKVGLKQFGADLSEIEIRDLMKAVCYRFIVFHNYSVLNAMFPIKDIINFTQSQGFHITMKIIKLG